MLKEDRLLPNVEVEVRCPVWTETKLLVECGVEENRKSPEYMNMKTAKTSALLIH